MATEVIMPKVDMVMDEGTLVEWLAKEGERVEKGDPLFVILTDKANIEIEAPASGILGGLRAKPDDVIPVTEVIAYILEPGEEPPVTIDRRTTDEQPHVSGAVLADVTPVPSKPAHPADDLEGDDRVRATPVARRLADEQGIDLARVVGRGPRGRVHKADVLAFVEQKDAEPQAPAIVALGAAELTLPRARDRKSVV